MKEGKYAKIVAKVKPVQFFLRERSGEMIFPNVIERRWCLSGWAATWQPEKKTNKKKKTQKPLSMNFATKA